MSGPYINGVRRQRIWLMGGRHGGSEKIRKRGDSLRRVVEPAQRPSGLRERRELQALHSRSCRVDVARRGDPGAGRGGGTALGG